MSNEHALVGLRERREKTLLGEESHSNGKKKKSQFGVVRFFWVCMGVLTSVHEMV